MSLEVEVTEKEIKTIRQAYERSKDLFVIGLRYASGATTEDLMKAHALLNLAATMGNERAVGYRSEISGQLSRPEVFAAQHLARQIQAAIA
jgi:hypothetical protein